MRRVAITLACALVVGCGGSAHTAKPASTAGTATQPRPASVEISLHGRDLRTVVFDHPLTLTGVVRQSKPAAPLRVRLLADAQPVQSAMSGEGGSFEFTVSPRQNTTYSVA